MIDILIKNQGKYLITGRNVAISQNVSYGGELNQTLLAKNQPIYEPEAFFKDTPLSDANGAVSASVTIDITYQSIAGFTVIFDVIGGVFPRQYAVYLKRKNETTYAYETINQGTVTANSPMSYVGLTADGIDRIEITASNINAPYARFKISNIYAGRIKHYTSRDIIDCNIIEQIDPISETIPYGICDFTLRSDDDIKNFDSEPKTIEVYHDGEFLGLFFVDSIKNLGNKKYQITSHDIIGELDKYQFVGDVYPETLVTDLISDIHRTSGLPDLSLSDLPEDSPTTKIQGHIPVSSCRDALQMVLQAAGWYADASRSFTINYKNLTGQTVVETNDIADGYEINSNTPISSVDILSHRFLRGHEQTYDMMGYDRYTSDEYGKGSKPIYIYTKAPADTSYVTNHFNAVMNNSNANLLLIDGTLGYPQSGGGYTTDWYVDLLRIVDNQKEYSAISNKPGDVIKIENNTLIHPSYSLTRANSILNWYSMPNTLTGKILGNIKAGLNLKINLLNGNSFSGMITKINYNPVGKHLISEVTMCGNSNN